MDYTDRREAKVNISDALHALGWKIHGFMPDTSDSMTDYYNPAHWNGIATKGDAVIVVDLDGQEAERLSGYQPTRHEWEKLADCDRCNGGGLESTEWTLTLARKSPLEWHKWRDESDPFCDGVTLFPSAVSPIPFDTKTGKPNCFKCHGTGELRKVVIKTTVNSIRRSNPTPRAGSGTSKRLAGFCSPAWGFPNASATDVAESCTRAPSHSRQRWTQP